MGMITSASSLQNAAGGECVGFATAPHDVDIFHPEPSKGWHELIDGEWKMLPEAGVFKPRFPSRTKRSKTKKAQVPLQCGSLVARLSHLDNWQEIKSQGDDPNSPRNLSSIAQANETCGDIANNIQNNCEK